jgi:hypothetical protein
MMDAKPAYDCAQADKAAGPSIGLPSACPKPERLDLRGEGNGVLLLKLGRFRAFALDQEEATRMAGLDVRRESWNEGISTIEEIQRRMRAKLRGTHGNQA